MNFPSLTDRCASPVTTDSPAQEDVPGRAGESVVSPPSRWRPGSRDSGARPFLRTRTPQSGSSACRRPAVDWRGGLRFLGCTYRPPRHHGQTGSFTGLGLAVSPKEVKRMSKNASGWRVHRLTGPRLGAARGWVGAVPGIDGLLRALPSLRAAPASCQDQLPRPGMDPGEIPAAQAFQGHETRQEPRPRLDAVAGLARR